MRRRASDLVPEVPESPDVIRQRVEAALLGYEVGRLVFHGKPCDACVGETVCGDQCPLHGQSVGFADNVWDAWKLVDRMQDRGAEFILETVADGWGWQVSIWDEFGVIATAGPEPSVARAICLAVRAAVMGKWQDE